LLDHRSEEKELMDDLTLNEAALIQNLEELATVNQWLGGRTTLISALNKIVQSKPPLKNSRITIADLGCGGGDLLRAMHKWSEKKHLAVKLVGIDANPFMIHFSLEHTNALDRIKYRTMNILSTAFKVMRFDIVCINTFCHHFTDAELIKLLKQLRSQVTTAIIINDLHRHWIAYFSIKWISRFFHFSYLAQNDGPLSVLRAFRRSELIDLIQQAGFDRYRIRWHWAFRWQVILWKQ